jgi:hypothetical protein
MNYPTYDTSIISHLRRQRAFSLEAFGPGDRREGVLDHMKKEMREVRESNGALDEWIDLVILAFDGAWRTGASPEDIADALAAKMTINESRVWPDWRTAESGKAIEHDRTGETKR